MTGPKIFFKFCATLFRFQSIKDRKQNHSRTAGDRKGWIQMTEMDNTKRDDKKGAIKMKELENAKLNNEELEQVAG